jgi:hypothetical protein
LRRYSADSSVNLSLTYRLGKAYTNTNFAFLKTGSIGLFDYKFFENYVCNPLKDCFNNLFKKINKEAPKKNSNLSEFPLYLNYASYCQEGANQKESSVPWEVTPWKDLRGISTINHEKLGILCF